MDPNYHIFKKSVQSKGKTVHKWYCYWNDPVTGVMHQKVCKGCKIQAKAYAFVSALPPLFVEEKITIAKIAEWMYIPGGPHVELKDLTILMVIDFLAEDPHSGSYIDEGHKAIYLMFLCCIKCGLRIGEAIGDRVNQLLFDQGMFVVDGFYRHNQLLRTTYNKCGSEEDRKIRVAPLPEDFAIIIQKYIAENNLSGDDYVFQRYNKPIRKWLAEEWFRRAVAKQFCLILEDFYVRWIF